MSTFADATQNYFRNILNKNNEILSQFNEAIRQQATFDRNFTRGTIIIGTEEDNFLYGKPSSFQKNVDSIFEKMLEDVDSNRDEFLKYMENGKNFSNKLIRALKSNYKDYIKRKKGSFLNPLTTIIQDLTTQQSNYNFEIAKYNIVTYGNAASPLTGSDGYQPKGQNPTVYFLTGDTILQSMEADGLKIKESLKNYLIALQTTTSFNFEGKGYTNRVVIEDSNELPKNDTFFPINNLNSKFDIDNFQRQYALLSQEVVDEKKYETFKNEIIASLLSNKSLMEQGNDNLSLEFDKYWITSSKPAFVQQNKAAKEFLKTMESEKLKNYTTYTEVDRKKERTLFYSNDAQGDEEGRIENRKKLINSLILPPTNTNKKTFNDISGDIVILKTKFN
jgi:hypothetical protein